MKYTKSTFHLIKDKVCFLTKHHWIFIPTKLLGTGYIIAEFTPEMVEWNIHYKHPKESIVTTLKDDCLCGIDKCDILVLE